MKKYWKAGLAAALLTLAWPSAGWAGWSEKSWTEAQASVVESFKEALRGVRAAAGVLKALPRAVRPADHGGDWPEPKSSLQAVVDACAVKAPIAGAEEFADLYGPCLQRRWPPLYIEWVWGIDPHDISIQCEWRAGEDAVEKMNGTLLAPGKDGKPFKLWIRAWRQDRERP